MSLDTLVGSKSSQPLVTLANYSRDATTVAMPTISKTAKCICEYVVPGVAVSAGISLVANSLFSFAQLVGMGPGPMTMRDSLLYVVAISPLMTQLFYDSSRFNRQTFEQAQIYGPKLPHGYQIVHDILHGSQHEEFEQVPALYELAATKQPPAA